MNDQEMVVVNQPFPANVPGEGYVPVTTRASKEPPSTSDHWKYEKLTQTTDADKQQIQTNKENITTLQGQVSTLEQEIEDVPTDVYTKTETDTLLGQKQDTLVAGANITIQGNVISAAGGGTPVDAYTKAETDALLADKADSDDVYTKTEADTLLNNKVDKVAGKGLSTNDFTNADKTKLDGIDMSTKQDALNASQLNAVNSGITAAKVAEIDNKSEVSGTNDGTNWTNITINGTTKAIPSGGGGGGFTPTQTQLDAMNSGITSSKVSTYDGYAAGKQDALSTAQLNACNSGIDSTKVAQITTNTNNIALKANSADIYTKTELDGTTGKLGKTTSIQNIEVVSAMPASPVATTLYIITGA